MLKRLSYLLPLLLACAVAGAVYFIPFSHAEGDFWHNLNATLQTGHVTSIFLPSLYPFLCAFFYKPFGPAGVEAFQAALYLALALCTLFTLRRAAGLNPYVPLAATLILLNPDLLSSIPKLWDTEMTTFLLAALLALSVALACTPAAPASRPPLMQIFLGLVWGLSLAVRPNFAFLAIPIAYALWLAFGKSLLWRGPLTAALALLTLAAADTLAHGTFYLPQNGPYNLYAGANPFTASSLLSVYNAEASLPNAMAAHGYHSLDADFYELRFQPLFTHYALQFIAGHPFEWLWLAVLKVFTLLRPDTKAHPLLSPAGSVKLLTALATPLWLALLFLSRPLRRIDKLLLLFVAAYILPFLLTNADPRFRPALDVLVLTHSAILLLRRYPTPEMQSSKALAG